MITIKSYGKINLFLDIEGRLDNGYHLIKTVMQSIDLHDTVFIEESGDSAISIECSDPHIPVDERNTCYKAAAILKDDYGINTGVRIRIEKKIPSEAGLAGGSGNSAAVIAGLDKLWNLQMSTEKMMKTGLRVGADVPFCLTGGTCLAEGIGERLTKLRDFSWKNILVVKPDFSMSTAYVYKNLLPDYYNSHSGNEIICCINSGDFIKAASCCANTLEKVVEKFHPEMSLIKNVMLEKNAAAALMTGSGSAVFGLFNDNDDMDAAYNEIIKAYPSTFKTKTSSKGIEFSV